MAKLQIIWEKSVTVKNVFILHMLDLWSTSSSSSFSEVQSTMGCIDVLVRTYPGGYDQLTPLLG